MTVTYCGAKKRKGGTCKQAAGHGTDHPGAGRCRLHGGMAPSGRKAAHVELAKRAVATYGLPRDVDPHIALVEELHRTAGAVAWLQTLIAGIDGPADLRQHVGGEAGGERPAVWVELYAEERRRLVDVAKTCIAVGVEERRARISEEQADLIARAIRGVLDELGVLDRHDVPGLVRRHLLQLVAGPPPDPDGGA